MSKQDNFNFLNIQTCVLKVHIHCEGCKKNVKKLLQKIDGVYTVNVDAEHGRVSVSGSVDPYTLIKKLGKAGKHAELLGPKGASINNNNKTGSKNHNNNNNINSFLTDQFQKLKLDGWKGQQQPQKQKDNGKPQKGMGGGKDQKGGGGGGGGGMQQMVKDMKLPQTQQLKGPNLPSQKDPKNVKFSLAEHYDEGSDFDDFDDEDEYYDDYDDDDLDDLYDDIEGIYDDHDTKSVGNNKKGDTKNDKKSGGGGGGGGGGKKSGDGPKDGKNNNNNGKNNKKGSEKTEGGKMMGQPMNGGPVGQLVPVNGMPAGMPAAANPYQQQQQYMQQMMRQQQQQKQMMMMNGPAVYGQPMGYMPAGPPMYGDPYGNYFSDENTNSGCSIM